MRIATKSPCVAKEDVLSDAMVRYQELFDTSADRPQYTPKEIADVYPNLEKEVNRRALHRVANASDTERGAHIAKVINRIEKMRSGEEENSWGEMHNVFPTSSIPELQKYFIDILTLWCLPTNSTFAEKSLEQLADSHGEVLSPCVLDVFALGPSVTEEQLDEIGKANIDRISLLNRKFRGDSWMPAWASDELDSLMYSNSAIEILLIIKDGRYYDLWDELEDGLDIFDISDRAGLIINLLRAYVR